MTTAFRRTAERRNKRVRWPISPTEKSAKLTPFRVIAPLYEKFTAYLTKKLTFATHRPMKGFHHPGGSQPAFLTGLAHLYNLVPYQRRALHAGQCGVEVEGGRVPTQDWMLGLDHRVGHLAS